MDSNPTLQQLHDRATRGEAITAEENVRLEQWYAEQDRAEEASLHAPAEPEAAGRIRTQIDATVAELRSAVEHIQSLTAENASVRKQIADLQAELVRKASATRA